MTSHTDKIRIDIEQTVDTWIKEAFLKKGDICVIGCSTSEIMGEHIGTSGSVEVAAIIYKALEKLRTHSGAHLAFQCCEHLNRALVIEKDTLEKTPSSREVTAIPVPKAGGSMASFAYKNMGDPIVVEHIEADAGIDIGDTMIGMHLKHVAVPLRIPQKVIGVAHLTGARTRPKLIGGVRANYDNTREK